MPYFDPDNPGVDTTLLETIDASGFGDTASFTDDTALPAVNYYYVVRGVNGLGDVSAASNPVGIFRFTLIPGSAAALSRENVPGELPDAPSEGRSFMPFVLRP